MTINWNFGDGANPPTAVDISPIQEPMYFNHTVTYSTPGIRNISVTTVAPGGCTSVQTSAIHIFDCSTPKIPHDAIVIDRDTTINVRNTTFWVNPGVTFSGGEYDTIYAEAGTSIVEQGYGIVFLKSGASYVGGGAKILICDPAAGVTAKYGGPILKCSNLQFDYTDAPPNVAFPQNGVDSKLTAAAITLSPNPTRGIINVNDAPLNLINVSVLNLLGANVMEVTKPNASGFQIDLTKLTPGIYYLRFVMPGAVITKKIVRQ